MVDRIKKGDLPEGTFGNLKTPCPRCGGTIRETYKRFECEKCDYKLWKVVASRQWEPEEIEELLEKRVIGPVQGFRSKMGRAFAAMIKLNAEHMPEFDFGNADGEGEGEEVDFSGQEPLGSCPKCQARVFEHGMAYVCEKAVGPAKSCDFRSGKIILQQEVSRGEMTKLLESGKTTLLKGFVSNRTKKKFSAYLTRGADGKVGFEFEPRAPKAPKSAPKDGAKATEAGEAVSKKPVTKVSRGGTAPAEKAPATKPVRKVVKKPAA
jgi:DNA topoisomerase-3